MHSKPVSTPRRAAEFQHDPASAGYRDLMLRFPAMMEWTAAAKAEHEDVEELDVEF